jgi:NADPH:quinone reductase-like Zn-dependent oxidoreductase
MSRTLTAASTSASTAAALSLAMMSLGVGLAVDFVVESDRAQLSEIVQRVRDGRLQTNIGDVSTLGDAVAALNPNERRKGKTIIRVRP